jgi:putative transposase
MPRRARLRIPGLPLHVIQRGNNKSACFRDDRDCRVYLSLLDQLSPLYGCAIHAYVLMTNHVHLLLTPDRAQGASDLMKHLGQRFAQFVNRKYDRTGSLFEGRFRSCIVDSDGYLLTCYRYVEMNPVRAGIVEHPSGYPWSSYAANAEGCASDIVVPHPLYLDLARDPVERCARYRALFQAVENPSELVRIRNATKCGGVLGRESFMDELPEPIRGRATQGSPGRPAKRREEC